MGGCGGAGEAGLERVRACKKQPAWRACATRRAGALRTRPKPRRRARATAACARRCKSCLGARDGARAGAGWRRRERLAIGLGCGEAGRRRYVRAPPLCARAAGARLPARHNGVTGARPTPAPGGARGGAGAPCGVRGLCRAPGAGGGGPRRACGGAGCCGTLEKTPGAWDRGPGCHKVRSVGR